MPQFWKERIFWLNLIGGVIQLLQYLLGKNYWPGAATAFSIILAALQIALNMISGGVTVSRLKSKLKANKIAY